MGIFGNSAGRDPRAGRSKNTTMLVNADFGLTADLAIVAGAYTVIGTYTVPFGVIAAWGADDTNGTATRSGQPAYIRCDVSGGAIAGSYRLVVTDPQRVNFVRIMEQRSERFAASTTGDRTIAVLMPETLPLVQPQSKMEIWLKPDASGTLVYNDADTLIRLPATFYV